MLEVDDSDVEDASSACTSEESENFEPDFFFLGVSLLVPPVAGTGVEAPEACFDAGAEFGSEPER